MEGLKPNIGFLVKVLGNKYQSKLLEVIDARLLFFSITN